MHYLVKIYHYGKNYSAMVPDLPGCIAAADTVEETRTLIAEAIFLHLDLMRKGGEKIPKPTKSFELTLDDLEDEEFCTWVNAVKPRHAKRKARIARG